ncbi:MAG: 4Fe-4S dicluster domain-containing protein, partial [Dehalococcoidales bacterium]|nr:4Fe-4S dicluster domain-containing protein [Dehalococcoidales bacterium]
KLQYDLACQKTVEQDMYLVQIPFFPATKAYYHMEDMAATVDQIITLYPDLLKCFGCNTCTTTCPQNIEVMWFMSDALRGDIREVANKSFDCVMCGLCAARCPQGLQPYHIALLCRRLYGRYLAPASKHLNDRVDEIEKGKYDAEIEELKEMSAEELNSRYYARDIEAA